MTTVVNNPTPSSDGGGSGFLIGVLILVIVVVLALYFGIPAIKSMNPIQVNVPAPQINVEAPQVTVPDNVEVNPAPTE